MKSECILFTYVRYIEGHTIPSGIKSCALEYGRKCPCKDYTVGAYQNVRIKQKETT